MRNKGITKKEIDRIFKEVYPKCVYADWKYCWQRIGNSIMVSRYKVVDETKCAACLAAHVNWGDGATRRPMTKEEILKEKEKAKTSQ